MDLSGLRENGRRRDWDRRGGGEEKKKMGSGRSVRFQRNPPPSREIKREGAKGRLIEGCGNGGGNKKREGRRWKKKTQFGKETGRRPAGVWKILN